MTPLAANGPPDAFDLSAHHHALAANSPGCQAAMTQSVKSGRISDMHHHWDCPIQTPLAWPAAFGPPSIFSRVILRSRPTAPTCMFEDVIGSPSTALGRARPSEKKARVLVCCKIGHLK